MIRLIATDLDDTLLNASAALSERTQRALEAAMAAGCGISLSSGRMLEAMLPLVSKLPDDGIASALRTEIEKMIARLS